MFPRNEIWKIPNSTQSKYGNFLFSEPQSGFSLSLQFWQNPNVFIGFVVLVIISCDAAS